MLTYFFVSSTYLDVKASLSILKKVMLRFAASYWASNFFVQDMAERRGNFEQIINLFSYAYNHVSSQSEYTALYFELSMTRSLSWSMMLGRVLMC